MLILSGALFFFAALACSRIEKVEPKRYDKPIRYEAADSETLARKLGLDDSEEAQAYQARLGDKPKEYAPKHLQVRDLLGRPAGLKKYEGQWLLINFFTSYAVPSQYQMPFLQALSKRWKDKGLQVVGIALEVKGNEKLVSTFTEALGVTFDIYMAAGETLEGKTPYGFIEEIPLILLVNPYGELEVGFVGPKKVKEIEKAVEKKLEK